MIVELRVVGRRKDDCVVVVEVKELVHAVRRGLDVWKEGINK